MKNKQEILGQYFTKPEIVGRLLNLIFSYKNYRKNISILEPSSGTGNFVENLKNRNFNKITEYEIDKELTENPVDFFEVGLKNNFDLIIGNPPFTKYNLSESYHCPLRYADSKVASSLYLNESEIKKDKMKIENAFISKSLKHLKNEDSSIAFVLPISFFIKNRNKEIKEKIKKKFSTMIIYQNSEMWFDRNIPCCFAIFINIAALKNKIVAIYENGEKNEEVFDLDDIHEELIPQIIFYKNSGLVNNKTGIPLKDFLETKKVTFPRSFKENNISAKNILEKIKIPEKENVSDYKIAIVRVGNSSVGKCGLVNIRKDILNDMFYVFDFKDQFDKNKEMKENLCKKINNNIEYFRNITCRVGSKSIKKENVLEFRV